MGSSPPQTSDDLKLIESDIPTYFVDGAVGSAFVGNVHRILFGEFVVDPTRGAELPAVRHNVNLVMTRDAVQRLITFLQEMPGIAPE